MDRFQCRHVTGRRTHATFVLERFTSFVLDVASGRQTLNEENGYHEIAIFKSGVTL